MSIRDVDRDHRYLYDIGAEESVLGAMLIDRDAIVAVAPILRPEHFARHEHRVLYRTMLEMYEQRVPIDLRTIEPRLDPADFYDRAPVTRLMELMSATPTAVHAPYYAEIVRDRALRRRMVDATDAIYRIAASTTPLENVLASALGAVTDVAADEGFAGISSMADLVEAAWERLDAPDGGRVPTGLRDLDRIIRGFAAGQFIVAAGRPGMGKSSLSIQTALHVAMQEQIPVGIISLEMSEEEILDRAVAVLTGVSMHTYAGLPDDGATKDVCRGRLVDGYGRLAEVPIYIHDRSDGTLADVLATAKVLRVQHRVGLLIVDYLQLISTGRRGNRTEEVTEVSRALKRLAVQLEIPVLALAQLSRALEHRPVDQRRPILSDLRESGSIEQDADIVLFIHRPDKYDPTATPNVAELIVAKHRNGPVDQIQVVWMPEATRFADMARQTDADYHGPADVAAPRMAGETWWN